MAAARWCVAGQGENRRQAASFYVNAGAFRRPVPFDAFTRNDLLGRQRETCYAKPEDWVFASAPMGGKMPSWAELAVAASALSMTRPVAGQVKRINEGLT
jgi:hypothetical protein